MEDKKRKNSEKNGKVVRASVMKNLQREEKNKSDIWERVAVRDTLKESGRITSH